jgi:hypothetical protein
LRPATIKVLGKPFTVSYVAGAPLSDELNGECDTDKQSILVRDGQPLESEQDTVLHEVFHAIDEAVDSKLKETQIKKVATAFLAVLKDNPKFVSYLRRRK